MLIHLSVHDFTIIHRLDVEFGAGLTVVTGETGAGKSLFVDALGLALGGRAAGDMVRPGAPRTEVTAMFDTRGVPEIAPLLEAAGLGEDDDHELILRRRISADGRSRSWINGSPVPTRTLREFGACLVDLQGQHVHHALMRPAEQRRILDLAAGHPELVARTAERHREFAAVEAELEAARAASGGDRAEREQRADFLRFQCDELAALNARENEARELELELKRLANVLELRAAGEEIGTLLEEGEPAASALVQRALARFAELERLLPDTTAEAREYLETALVHIAEANRAARDLTGNLESDPERLAAIEHRLATLNDMARKHRVSPDELPAHLATLEIKLERLGAGEEHKRELERRREEALERYRAAALELRKSRMAARAPLADEVTRRMHELGIEGGEFAVAISEPRATPAASGLDDVTFEVRTNPGHPLTALARTASGGERSRISLGILGATHGGLPVMIFDEIDTGVGGRVAELVGRHLRRLAADRQVLCVTHLPQVASQGHGHFTVTKDSADDEMAGVRVQPIEGEERTREIARMLAGENVTERSLDHAREMLGAAAGEDGAPAQAAAAAS